MVYLINCVFGKASVWSYSLNVTVSDGFTGSNAGLDLASSSSAGIDLLLAQFPCESQ